MVLHLSFPILIRMVRAVGTLRMYNISSRVNVTMNFRTTPSKKSDKAPHSEALEPDHVGDFTC